MVAERVRAAQRPGSSCLTSQPSVGLGCMNPGADLGCGSSTVLWLQMLCRAWVQVLVYRLPAV